MAMTGVFPIVSCLLLITSINCYHSDLFFEVDQLMGALGDDHAAAFQRLDVDLDGKLTAGEILASDSEVVEHMEYYLSRYDRNRDGNVTQEDFINFWKDKDEQELRMRLYTATNAMKKCLTDPKLNATELKKYIASLTTRLRPVGDYSATFKKIDSNGDKLIDAEELTTLSMTGWSGFENVDTPFHCRTSPSVFEIESTSSETLYYNGVDHNGCFAMKDVLGNVSYGRLDYHTMLRIGAVDDSLFAWLDGSAAEADQEHKCATFADPNLSESGEVRMCICIDRSDCNEPLVGDMNAYDERQLMTLEVSHCFSRVPWSLEDGNAKVFFEKNDTCAAFHSKMHRVGPDGFEYDTFDESIRFDAMPLKKLEDAVAKYGMDPGTETDDGVAHCGQITVNDEYYSGTTTLCWCQTEMCNQPPFGPFFNMTTMAEEA